MRLAKVSAIESIENTGNDDIITTYVDVYLNLDQISSVNIHPIIKHTLSLVAKYESKNVTIVMSNGSSYEVEDEEWYRLLLLISEQEKWNG